MICGAARRIHPLNVRFQSALRATARLRFALAHSAISSAQLSISAGVRCSFAEP